ncbi:MAG: T9SS type A sorting domain-containing protein [Saprospiraceae bacterium]|nr:T9SS type A sorting domain-containing protein [Saprospiraceae bacterium]
MGRRSVSYSNDLGKNWDYIDLGLESKVNFDVKLIGDSLYVLNSNGLYRRNINDIIRLVGTNNDDAELNIGLSPNPVTQNLTISLPNSLDINMKIIDINGRISFQETIKNKATFDVDFGSYMPGIYIIQLNIDGKMIAKKVVKI